MMKMAHRGDISSQKQFYQARDSEKWNKTWTLDSFETVIWIWAVLKKQLVDLDIEKMNKNYNLLLIFCDYENINQNTTIFWKNAQNYYKIRIEIMFESFLVN